MHYPASVQQATPEIISTTVDPSRYLPQAHYSFSFWAIFTLAV
jgi:hypothetical protein